MSFSFHISGAASPPSVDEVLGELHPQRLQLAEADEVDREAPWPDGYLHLYLLGESNRSVEVSLEDGIFGVRIMSCSNRVDHELAKELVRRLARATGASEIAPEDDEPMSLERFELQYGEEWVTQQVEANARAVLAMARDRGEVLTFNGAVRPYHLGPRHLARLSASCPDDQLAERLLEDIRRVQHLCSDNEPSVSRS